MTISVRSADFGMGFFTQCPFVWQHQRCGLPVNHAEGHIAEEAMKIEVVPDAPQ